MKKYVFMLFGGLGIGVVLSFIYFNTYLSDYLISQSELEDNLNAYISKDKNSTSYPTISPNFWQRIVADASLSTVAIESFSSNRLISKGSGIIVSSDGLIMTTADISKPANVYQVYLKDQVVKGKVVYRNVAKNISFLKVDQVGLNAASFAVDYEYKSGTDAILTGKTVELSKLVDFSQRALINYVLDRSVVIDTNSDAIINGSKVIDSQNLLLGMAYIRNNKTYLVSSIVIEETISEYLSEIN